MLLASGCRQQRPVRRAAAAALPLLLLLLPPLQAMRVILPRHLVLLLQAIRVVLPLQLGLLVQALLVQLLQMMDPSVRRTRFTCSTWGPCAALMPLAPATGTIRLPLR